MQQFNNFFRRASTPAGPGPQAQQPGASQTQTQTQTRRKSHDPVLTQEDEAFLRSIMAESSTNASQDAAPGPGPEVGTEPEAAPNTSQLPPLPPSPAEELGKEIGEQDRRKSVSGIEASNLKDQNEEKKPEALAKTGQVEGRPKSPEKKRRPWSMIWRKSDKKVSSSAFCSLE